jgi:hypothetical protein
VAARLKRFLAIRSSCWNQRVAELRPRLRNRRGGERGEGALARFASAVRFNMSSPVYIGGRPFAFS